MMKEHRRNRMRRVPYGPVRDGDGVRVRGQHCGTRRTGNRSLTPVELPRGAAAAGGPAAAPRPGGGSQCPLASFRLGTICRHDGPAAGDRCRLRSRVRTVRLRRGAA
eukprot:690127-Hanusia_phi.AAC.1